MAAAHPGAQPYRRERLLLPDGAAQSVAAQSVVVPTTRVVSTTPVVPTTAPSVPTTTAASGSSTTLQPTTTTGTSMATTTTTAAPGFGLKLAAARQTVFLGETAVYEVAVDLPTTAQGPASFSVSGLPSGATGRFDPPNTFSATKLLVVVANGNPGLSKLTITARFGSSTRTMEAELVTYHHIEANYPNLTIENPEGDFRVLPGTLQTLKVTLERAAANQQVYPGSRARFEFEHQVDGLKIVEPAFYLAIGESVILEHRIGAKVGLEKVTLTQTYASQPRFGNLVTFVVSTYTIRPSQRQYEVVQGQSVEIALNIETAPGFPAESAMLIWRQVEGVATTDAVFVIKPGRLLLTVAAASNATSGNREMSAYVVSPTKFDGFAVNTGYFNLFIKDANKRKIVIRR